MKIHRLTALALLAVAHAPASAAAQPRGVVLEPRLRGEVEGVGHALDRVLHAQLRAAGVLALGPTPALGLEDLQLAVGCVAETTDCLDAVAAQLEVATLVYLDVERAGSELVLTLSVFEVGATEVRAVTRRIGGEDAEARALDAVDPMLREAFGLPPPEPEVPLEPESDAEATTSPGGPAQEPRGDGGFEVPILPVVLLASAAVALGVGIGVGAQSQDTLSQYERAAVADGAGVDAALGLYSRAESEAIAANVLFAVAGALAVGGAVAWIVDASSGDADDVAVAPVIGPGGGGLLVAGRFGGAR